MYLICRNQRLVNQISSPLLQNVVVLRKVRIVVRSLGISQSHNQHVPTFFKRLRFSVAIVMASCVGIAATDVVDAVCIWPIVGLLVNEERVEDVFEQSAVQIDGDRVEWKDHVNGVDVPV